MVGRLRGWTARGALVLGLGCGDGPTTPAAPPTELAELCGSLGPVQLLSVGEHDRTAGDTTRLQRFGQRLVYAYESFASDASHPQEGTTTLYSVGTCGEDATVIGDDVDVLYEPDDHAGHLLGCRSATGDVLMLDVEGRTPPRALLPAVGCVVRPYEGGLVGVQREPGETVGSLVFLADLVDPEARPQVVLEGVRVPEADPRRPHFASVRLSASSDDVLVLTEGGALTSVEPRTGDRTVLRPMVRSFLASADLRWVLWREGDPLREDPEEPEEQEPSGTIRLLDRETGEDVFEGVGALGSEDVGIDGDMVRIVRDDRSTRLVMLPSLLQIDTGPEWRVYERHSSGVVLMRPSEGDGRFGMDPQTRSVWPIVDGAILGVEDVGNDQLVLNQRHDRHDFSYWRGSVHGGEPELLAEHVLAPVWLSGGRVSTVRELDDSMHGQLWIIDPETGEETLLDGGGVFWRTLGPRAPRGHPWPYDDDVIVWSVHDGERSGLWAARVR